MTREEAIKEYVIPALKHTWNEKVNKKVLEAIEQEPVLDKLRAEIEQIEIDGHIRDVECFTAGINTALNVINKYKAESEEDIKNV